MIVLCNSNLLRRCQYTKCYKIASCYFYSKNYSKRNDRWSSLVWFSAGFFGATFATSSYLLYKNSKKLKYCNLALCATRKISLEDVSKHKSVVDGGIWVTYNDKVYDVTEFIKQHPGGSDKIMLAAGKQLEPFWSLYAVHQNNKEVLSILSELEIGELDEESKRKLASKASSGTTSTDHFSYIPYRHPALQVVNEKPFNAETPQTLITDNNLTPNEIFFVRNHLPVPFIKEEDYQLQIEASGIRKPLQLTLAELKKLPHHTVEATIMCSGNRRSDMGTYKPVRGLPWQNAAISNASWTGVRLVDLLAHLGIEPGSAKHVHFEGGDLDSTNGQHYSASLPIEVALNAHKEVLIAWDMNGEPLSPDHGAPVRLIVPGVVGARQVKWLTRMIFSDTESQGFWQQNDYKTFSPSADPDNLDWRAAEAIIEAPVISAICSPTPNDVIINEGTITTKGYAWSGGGRGILRVELSADNGLTWIEAQVFRKNRPRNAHWSWALWEAEVPVPEKAEKVTLICKAVDSSQNQQPESYKGSWNVRGLMANAWHRVPVTLIQSDD